MKRGQTQVVTGLSVFDQTPRISRKVKNKIRTACFLYTRIPSERLKKQFHGVR